MANSYVRLLIHCVWSTKYRQMCLAAEWEEALWRYIAGSAKRKGIHPVQIGGIENHVHALVEPPKSMNIPQLLEILKTPASNWINRTGRVPGQFHWQVGYGAFSVSPSLAPRVARYIRNQRKHHERQTFDAEYRQLIKRNGIPAKSRYLLD